MSEYNSPIDYGQAHPGGFFTKYPPITGRISRNPYDWGYGGTNLYPRPFNSWFQQINQGNYSLGPFARRVDNGKSGRIKMSLSEGFGEPGFVEQCWYDFPRGNNDTDGSGNKYPENREFWAQAETHRCTVWNLMGSGGLVEVDVAISNTRAGDGTSSDPQTFSVGAIYGGGFWGLLVASVNILAGRIGGYPGDTSDCGENDVEGSTPVGWLPVDAGLSFGEGLGLGGLGVGFGPDGLGRDLLNDMYNGFDAAGKAAVGDAFSDANIDNNFATWLANHTSKLTDMLNALKDRLNSLAETISDNDIGWHIIRAGHMLGAAGSGADLFINAWIIPNILQSAGPNGRGDHTYGTAANPHKWRPNNGAQQRFISYMNSDPTTGGPKSDLNQSSDEPGWGVIDARDYVPRGTPDGAFNQNQKDWEWYLTLLNRGDITTMPYIDPATNEYVFTEDYDFSGGGSIAQFDDFLDEVEAEHGAAVKDSVGTFLDMMPVAPGFVVPFGIPIIMLESIAVAMKQNRIDQGNPYNETISNLTNLDAYRNTKIEVRINANNVKIGNPKMYEYLTTVGIPDGNGNYIKMNPVP